MIDKEKLSYAMCQTSAAHTYGNLTAYIQNWLIDLFPKDTFNTIHVHSKIAHNQLRSTNHEVLKKKRPAFVIRPRIEYDTSDAFLAQTLVMERIVDQYNTYDGTNLQEFIYDRNRQIAVKFQLNRNIINFDVVLIFSTYIEQINWVTYFKNVVRQNRPILLETCLESYLPPDMMKVISECVGIPVHDENGSVREFVEYLNSKTLYPITYKIQGSTGNEEFFRYYPVRIDTQISNLSGDEGERNGQITTNYQISFSVRCEFNATGFYYIFSDKIDEFRRITVEPSGKLIPIFTDVFCKEDLNLKEGWSLYNSPSCRLDNDEVDEVDLFRNFNSSMKAIITYHLKHGIPLDLFIETKVRRQGKLLRSGIDYKMDYTTGKLYFFKCSTYYTYKVLVMINVAYINNLIADVYPDINKK